MSEAVIKLSFLNLDQESTTCYPFFHLLKTLPVLSDWVAETGKIC